MNGAIPLPVWVQLLAMAVAGAFGAATARERHAPIYGTLFAGIIVGLGGGMVRDILLDVPVVAIQDWLFIPIVAAAAIAGALVSRWIADGSLAVIGLQGLSLGLLVVIGSQRAIQLEVPMAAVIFLGMVTATVGGIILDAMTARQSAALAQNRLFASAAFVGAIVFWALSVTVGFWPATAVTVALVAFLRVGSVHWRWNAPEWPRRDRGTPEP